MSALSFETNTYQERIRYIHHRIHQEQMNEKQKIEKDEIELTDIHDKYSAYLDKLNEVNIIISKQERRCRESKSQLDIEQLVSKHLQEDINIKLAEIEKNKLNNSNYIQKIHEDILNQKLTHKTLQGLKVRICKEIDGVNNNLEVTIFFCHLNFFYLM